jgi:hypothetical protein
MEKLKAIPLTLLFTGVFFALSTFGMGIDEYYEAYAEYLGTGSSAAKSRMDDFRWPPKIDGLDSLLTGRKFLALLKGRDNQSISNVKLAYGLEALGKLFKASDVGAPSDNPTLMGVQGQYREMRLEAIEVLKQAYYNPPSSRDQNHFDGTIAVALKSLGEAFPEQRENPAGNVPVKAAPLWLQVKELAGRLTKTLPPGEDASALGKQLAQLLESALNLKIPREERFKVASILLESWKQPGRSSLVAETGGLVGKLIGRDGGVEKFVSEEESALKEAFSQFFLSQFESPEKIPAAHRFSILDLADGQLEQLGAARHPLDRFVHLAERAASMTIQARAPWMERARALLPKLNSLPMRPTERFLLAQRLIKAIESDNRLAPKNEAPTTSKTFLYPDLEVLAVGLGSLLSTEEVRRAEGASTQGVDQAKIRSNAESLLTKMAAMQSANTQFQEAAENSLSEIGGVPIYDPDTYLKALQELVELEKPGDISSYSRRRKLEKALLLSADKKHFDALSASDRNRYLERLTPLIVSDSRAALPIAFHAIEAMGKLDGKRRFSMPEPMVARLKEISGIDARSSDALLMLKEQAAATLKRTGYQPVVEITSPSEYVDAVRKVGEHEGRASENTKALQAAIAQFDLKKLDQNMKPAERSNALSHFLPILNGNSKWAKVRALAVAVPLMGKGKLRETELLPIRDRIWELTSLGPNSSINDREIRLSAVAALEGLGEKPVKSLGEWMAALQLAHTETRGFQRASPQRFRPVDLYSLERGLAKGTPAEIRIILSALTPIIEDPNASVAVRTRALSAFGEAAVPDIRRGVGVPRSGFAAVRRLAADETLSSTLREAAVQALSRLGVHSGGAVSDLLELDLTEARTKEPLETVLEGLLERDPSTVLKWLSALESWSLQEFFEEAGLAQARSSAQRFGELLGSNDNRVRRAALRQVWRWSRDAKALPAWFSDNRAFRVALISGLAQGAAEERAMAIEVVGNRLSGAKSEVPGLVNAVQKVLQSGESSQEARFAAAKALLNHPVSDPASAEAIQRQRGLRVAFAKAPEDQKLQYAELLSSLAKSGAPRPADPVLLAAEWLTNSKDTTGVVDVSKLSELVREGLESSDLAKAKKSWGALNWLTAEPESGRARALPSDPQIIGLPSWVKKDSRLVAAILGNLVNKDEALRDEAVSFVRSRRPAEQIASSEPLRLAAWNALSQANRFLSSSPQLAGFLKPKGSLPGRSQTIWSSTEAHAALRAAIQLNPQFHAEASSEIVRAVSEVDQIRFESGPGEVSREEIAQDILDLVEALDRNGTSATIPAAFALAKLTWKGSGRTVIPKQLTDSLVSIFRGYAGRTGEGDLELELPRFARETLQAMGRREKVLAHGDPSRRQRAERPSLVGIVGRLLSEFPSVQEEAVHDLSKWRTARSGEKTFQEELENWRKTGGPNFDAIMAKVLGEPTAGEEPFASSSLKTALAAELVELAKPRSNAPEFQPGLPGAESTTRVMARNLYSPDPKLRASAEEWIKRYRTLDRGGDSFLPNLMAESLRDPERQGRALQVLTSLVPFRLKGYQVPSWVLASIPIQKALLELVAELPKDQKESPGELLLTKLSSALRLTADETVRNMEQVKGFYQLKLTPDQEKRSELVATALKILETGDAFGKVAAMEYLALIKVPDSRITQTLFDFAKNPQEAPELRAHALEALSKRNIRWDYSVHSPEVDALVSYVWDRFVNEKDPDIRAEAARFLFAHTSLIRQMPSPQEAVTINGRVETTAHGILIGLRELERVTANNPLPSSWKASARTAYDEVFLGTAGGRLPSIESFAREGAWVKSQSREEACAWATKLLGPKKAP